MNLNENGAKSGTCTGRDIAPLTEEVLAFVLRVIS